MHIHIFTNKSMLTDIYAYILVDIQIEREMWIMIQKGKWKERERERETSKNQKEEEINTNYQISSALAQRTSLWPAAPNMKHVMEILEFLPRIQDGYLDF